MIGDRPKRKRGRPAKAGGVLPSSQYPYMLHPDGSNKKSVAAFLNISVRAIDIGMARHKQVEARIAEGWFCEQCGRRIRGKLDKVFCSAGCRANHGRDERRRDARLERLLAGWFGKK